MKRSTEYRVAKFASDNGLVVSQLKFRRGQIENAANYDISTPLKLRTVQTSFPKLYNRRNLFEFVVKGEDDDLARQAYARAVENSKNAYKEMRRKVRMLKKFESRIVEGSVEITQTTWEYELDGEKSLSTLFDELNVSSAVPFASLHKTVYPDDKFFYKIFPSAEIRLKWIETPIEKNTFVAKLATLSGRSFVQLVVTPFSATVRLSKGDELLEIPEILDENTKNAVRVHGTAKLETASVIDKHLFMDMVMNDDDFSYFLSVNEGNTIQTQQNLPRLSFKWGNSRTMWSVQRKIIFEQLTTKTVGIKISGAESVDDFNSIVEVFSRLLGLYEQRKNSVRKIYENLMEKYEMQKFQPPSSPKECVSCVSNLEELKRTRPDIFVTNYSRTICQAGKQPKIVPDEVASSAGPSRVMKFEGLNYSCAHNPEHIWPGLVKNTLNNKKEFPVLPCCFKRRQDDNPQSLYHKFLKGKLIEYKKFASTYVLGPEKPVLNGRIGALPPIIERWLELYVGFTGFVRMGVQRSDNSFMHCAYTVFNDDFPKMSNEQQVISVASYIATMGPTNPKSFMQKYNANILIFEARPYDFDFDTLDIVKENVATIVLIRQSQTGQYELLKYSAKKQYILDREHSDKILAAFKNAYGKISV